MLGARVPRIAQAGPLLLVASLIGALANPLGGCSDNSFSGDAFPIHVDLSTGAVMVDVQRGTATRTATLDVMAPITVFDQGPDAPVRRRSESLIVRGIRMPGDIENTVPRAVLSADVFDLHPCSAEEYPCRVGRTSERDFAAVIGADALAGDAVRFDFQHSDLYILPDIAGSNGDRTRLCDGVFPSPFRGGGTVLLDGAEVTFGGRRISIGACLDAEPRAATAFRGADALFVASTGVGISILTAAAYERWRVASKLATLTPFATLSGTAPTSVRLSSGLISGWKVQVTRLALVATIGSNPRGPCNEVYAHYLVRHACSTDDLSCLCSDPKACSVPAVVTIDRPVEVLVVVDSDPTLQALRAELRPDEAEVDGILGTDVMADLQVDVDYPHNRVLTRCAAGAAHCFNARQVAGVQDRQSVIDCNTTPDPTPPPDAGMPDAATPTP